MFLIDLHLSLLLSAQYNGGSHYVEYRKVVFEDGVLHSFEDKADVLCVCRTSEVGVDGFLLVWILLHKHFQNELFG